MRDENSLTTHNIANVVARLADLCQERSEINKRFGNKQAEMFWEKWALVIRHAHSSGKRQAGEQPIYDNSERELN